MAHRFDDRDRDPAPFLIEPGDILADVWGDRGKAIYRDHGIPDGWVVELLHKVKRATVIHADGRREEEFHPAGTRIFWPFDNIRKVNGRKVP